MKITTTLYTDYLISQKYKKWSPGKYAMLLYVTVSIHPISIRSDALTQISLSSFEILKVYVLKIWDQQIKFVAKAQFLFLILHLDPPCNDCEL